LSQGRASELKARGIESISAIPADYPLTAKQTIIRDAIANRRPYVAPDLACLLRDCGPPTCYLDFEAIMPPIPLYEGTRPYQTIPFQWSLHTTTGDGTLCHREFLAEGDEDPRRRFAETLIEALEAFDAPVIVYSTYEQTRLNELADEFPALRASLYAVVSRLVDLLPIVRGAVYFQSSTSLTRSNSLPQPSAPVLAMTTLRKLPMAARLPRHSCGWLLAMSGRPTIYEPRFSHTASEIRLPFSKCIER
jgi:hypothetical protein